MHPTLAQGLAIGNDARQHATHKARSITRHDPTTWTATVGCTQHFQSMKHTERCATWGSDTIARKRIYIRDAQWTKKHITMPSMKDYGYWEFDTKEQLLNITYMAMLAEDIGITLSQLHKDKAGGNQ